MDENLAIRVNHEKVNVEAIRSYVSPVPLFKSGAEAAAHGMRDVENQSDAAMDAADKITRIRSRKGRA
jgi:hypothetical protein